MAGCGGRELPEGGICVHIELIHFVVQQKLTQHCKTIILQLRKNLLISNCCIITIILGGRYCHGPTCPMRERRHHRMKQLVQGSRGSKQQTPCWKLACWFQESMHLAIKPAPNYGCSRQVCVKDAHYPTSHVWLPLNPILSQQGDKENFPACPMWGLLQIINSLFLHW